MLSEEKKFGFEFNDAREHVEILEHEGEMSEYFEQTSEDEPTQPFQDKTSSLMHSKK